MYAADIFTVPANLGGFPAISVPSGSVTIGSLDLPLGMQFVAPYLREDLLFTAGESLMTP